MNNGESIKLIKKYYMTQEEKFLLIKDLYARLPYEIKVVYLASTYTIQYIDITRGEVKLNELNHTLDIGYIKPYLRSMSSMTEEEQKEFGCNCGLWKREGDGGIHFINRLPNLPNEFADILISEIIMARAIDWLNEHHFDYRGLIEKGLALEAPKDMYKID